MLIPLFVNGERRRGAEPGVTVHNHHHYQHCRRHRHIFRHARGQKHTPWFFNTTMIIL